MIPNQKDSLRHSSCVREFLDEVRLTVKAEHVTTSQIPNIIAEDNPLTVLYEILVDKYFMENRERSRGRRNDAYESIPTVSNPHVETKEYIFTPHGGKIILESRDMMGIDPTIAYIHTDVWDTKAVFSYTPKNKRTQFFEVHGTVSHFDGEKYTHLPVWDMIVEVHPATYFVAQVKWNQRRVMPVYLDEYNGSPRSIFCNIVKDIYRSRSEFIDEDLLDMTECINTLDDIINQEENRTPVRSNYDTSKETYEYITSPSGINIVRESHSQMNIVSGKKLKYIPGKSAWVVYSFRHPETDEPHFFRIGGYAKPTPNVYGVWYVDWKSIREVNSKTKK